MNLRPNSFAVAFYCNCSILLLQCSPSCSDLRRRLLTFFYVNRSARAYVRQSAAALNADSTNVSRELARLEREGLLHSELEGRQLYYSLNRDYPYLKPLFALLQGSIGIQPALTRALRTVSDIESAWIYGSFAKNETDAASDIDLLIVGRPHQLQLAAEIRKTEKGAPPRNQLHCSFPKRTGAAAPEARPFYRGHLERKAYWTD